MRKGVGGLIVGKRHDTCAYSGGGQEDFFDLVQKTCQVFALAAS